jgi:hypothetical protein
MVYGVLEFSNEKDTVLGANRIIVVGGKLVVGWADQPLRVKAHIKLTGSRNDKEYTLNDGTTVGSKVSYRLFDICMVSVAIFRHPFPFRCNVFY